MALDWDDYKHMLAFRFKEARAAAGLTQEQATERLGWSQSEISKIENGEREFELFHAIELAVAYRTSLSDLVRAIRDSPAMSADEINWLDRGFFGTK
jgi:transcriptional regulator with XRE-family HTH domain